MVEKNINKKGATSHYEILHIVKDFLTENLNQISESLEDSGIKIEDYRLEKIMDMILTDITDRIINFQITPDDYISERYEHKFITPRW